jgi:hypothetical protein
MLAVGQRLLRPEFRSGPEQAADRGVEPLRGEAQVRTGLDRWAAKAGALLVGAWLACAGETGRDAG